LDGLAWALLLLIGIAPASSIGFLGYWKSESPLLIANTVLSTLAGVAMAASGLWLLITIGCSRWALWVGGAATIFQSANWAWGILTNIILCSGPA